MRGSEQVFWGDVLKQAGQLRAEEQPFVLATVVAYKSPQSAKPGSKAIIRADGTVSGWVGGGCVQPIVLREARKALETGKPKLLSISPDPAHEDWKGVESYRMACEGGGSLEIYLEPVLPKPELLIVGHSPVAQIISQLGRLLDFKVCIADPEANSGQFPDVDLILTDLGSVRSRIDETSFVVVATMGNGDEEGLQAVVGTKPKYLGFVASEKKARSLFGYLRDKGITDDQLSNIKSPAGLELGGETLPEIALSVMAEVTRLRRTLPAGDETEPASTAVALSEVAIDPICGMTVDVKSAKYSSVFENKTVYFCCLRCKEMFDHPQITQISHTNQ